MRPNPSGDRPSTGGGAGDVPTGSLASDATQTTLAAITLSVTGAVGVSSYLWSAVCSEPPDSNYTSAAAPASPTSASTTLTPDGPGDYVISCALTGLGGTSTLRRLVTVTRPRPAPSSTLGAVVYMAAGTYAPTLSETAGADGTIVWATSCTKVTDGSSVSVTGSATTTPTITIAAGTAYRVRHRCTDGYGRVTDYVVSVSESSGGASDLTLSLSTGATVAQSSPGAQAITATATGGTGSKTYAWTATYINSGSSAAALLSASTGNPVTLTTTAAGQQVQVVCTATDSGSPAQTAVAAVAVAVTPGPAWVTRLDYDATAPATFGALASGTNTIGALDWTVTTAVPVTIDHTQGTGITVSALATALQALQTNVQSVLTGGANANPVRVSMVVDSITINTNSQSVSLCATSGVQATTGSSRIPAFCLRLHRTSSTDFRMRTYTNGTGATIGGTGGLSASTGVTIAASLPSSAVYETYLYGPLAGGLITTGTTTIPAAADPFTVFEANATYNRASFMAAIADRSTAIDSWPALWAGPGITASGTLAYTYVIKRLLVQEWV